MINNSRTFDQQQEYIEELQRLLDKGKLDQDFIQTTWPPATCSSTWKELVEGEGASRVYEVRLKEWGFVWGKDILEHTAWSLARAELENKNVLPIPVQKMDAMEAGQ